MSGGAEAECLLEGLGVSAVDASALEKDLWAQAQAADGGPEAADTEETAADGGKVGRAEQRLHTVQREIGAVLAALDNLDAQKAATAEADATHAEPALEDGGLDAELDAAAKGGLVETERDRLIRLGVLTPFDRLDGYERRIQSGSAAERSAGDASTSGRDVEPAFQNIAGQMAAIKAMRARTRLLPPGALPARERAVQRVDEGFWRQAASGRDKPPPRKRRRHTLPRERRKAPRLSATAATLDAGPRQRRRRRRAHVEVGDEGSEGSGGSASDCEPSGEEADVDDGRAEASDVVSEGGDSDQFTSGDGSDDEDALGVYDDVDDDVYAARLERWLKGQQKGAVLAAPAAPGVRPGAERAVAGMGQPQASGGDDADGGAAVEGELPDVVFDGGYRIPGDIYARLFDYQKTGVKWMWELHTQRAGGIVGDEMGLGKTVQVAAFLAGLHHSRRFRPSIVVCPATVLRQWLRELRCWYPPFRVAVLHDSQRTGHLPRPSREEIVRMIAHSESGILLTSYDQLRLQRKLLLGVSWGYAILDEGHKIRNPDAEVTLSAKQLATVHRVIMSGSPIQNRLAELWSLFDFVFPGKLGTLPVFRAQFALPIQFGGYANASAQQVSTAYKCAVVLRDLIAPYLLRRRKEDVAQQLPSKTEQVLFCTLTNDQRSLYRSYLASAEVADILADRRNALAGIDILRKICNHPDLLQRAKWEGAPDYGNPARSGKLTVAMKVLAHWHQTGHRALLFTQTQQMLDIAESVVQAAGLRYHRMDGSTAVGVRARLVDDFNNNAGVFVFLLTTKVGGLGINLTGADRVMLFDPDWNPATDTQARERAWRIGQTRPVTVYRLITAGTIEEKVYHRQIYKQFLTNKVLRDPRQKRFFKARDIHDLFTLGSQYAGPSETAEIFASLPGSAEVPLGTEGALDPDTIAVPAEAAAGAAEIALQEAEASAEEDGDAPAQSGGAASSAEVGGSGGARRSTGGRTKAAGEPVSCGARPSPAGAGADAAVAPEAAANGSGGGEDARVLRELFEGAGVASALDHARIEAANDPEALQRDHAAARVARRAADALRRSRAACEAAPINVPTWTGRSGAGGAPPAIVRRFGAAANPRLLPPAPAPTPVFGAGARAGTSGGTAPRSADLLAALAARRAAVSASADDDPELEAARELSGRIVDFLAAAGGRAPSGAVVQRFAPELRPPLAPMFRQLLHQVAKLERDGEGRAWVLRPDFAPGDGQR
ncbi:hypothetical protein WJX81_000181 [Elliptochloris bilobata]|uniref:Uncharacterized protein n=1 Tax=Elliptochloris bilobata TaxID=381761 RepID=A0AAW1R0E4_9CHLO